MADSSYTDHLDRLKKSMDRLADLVERQGVAALGLGGSATPSPDAFGVVSLGKGQGFGTLDQAGGFSGSFFAQKHAADAFADQHKRFYDALAAKVAPPPPTSRMAPLGQAIAAAVAGEPAGGLAGAGGSNYDRFVGAVVRSSVGSSPAFRSAERMARIVGTTLAPPTRAAIALPDRSGSNPAAARDDLLSAGGSGERVESAYAWRRKMEAMNAQAARMVPPGKELVPLGEGGTGSALARRPPIRATGFRYVYGEDGAIDKRRGSFANPIDVGGKARGSGLARRPPIRATGFHHTYGSGGGSGSGSRWRRWASAAGSAFGRGAKGYGSRFGQAKTSFGQAWRTYPGSGGPFGNRYGRSGYAATAAASSFTGLPVGKTLMAASGIASEAGLVIKAASDIHQVIKRVVTDIGKIGVNAYRATERMRDYAENINQGNRGAARVNARISGAFQQLDFNQYGREIRMAKATEGTTVTLARSVDRMREQWSEIDSFRQNVRNRAAGFFAGVTGEVGNGLGRWAAPVGIHLNALDPNGVNANANGAALGAGVMAVPGQVMNNPMLGTRLASGPFGWLQLFGETYAGSLGKAGNAFAAAKANALKPDDFADRWHRAISAEVKAGPVRGMVKMPKL